MIARQVLVIGRSPQIMTKVKTLLNTAGFVHLGALTDEEALEAMSVAAPDALVVGGGVEPASRAALIAAFAAAWPGRPIIEHSGGPYGLLDRLHEVLR